MGFILRTRRRLGLEGETGGSAARDTGLGALFGTPRMPFEEPPAYEVALDDDHLPWELGEHR